MWHSDPVYCAASVLVYEGIYTINTSSWVGMPNDANDSLRNYLEKAIKTDQF